MGVATYGVHNKEDTVIQMDFRADQRHSQTLSPRLQHAVRLLQMSSLDFGLMVRDTLGKNPEGRKVKGVIHWVPAAESVECEVRLYDRLFRSANPEKDEEGGSFLDNINPESLVVLKGSRA